MSHGHNAVLIFINRLARGGVLVMLELGGCEKSLSPTVYIEFLEE